MVSQINTKDLILKKAEQIFFENGYYKTKIDDIAKSAKVAKGTIYLYFKSKEDLFISIIEKNLGDFYNKIKEVSEKEKSNSNKLKNIILHVLKEYSKRKVFLKKVEIHRLVGDKDLREHFKKRILPILMEIRDYIIKIIKNGIKEGELKGENAEAISAFIFGGIKNACITHEFMDENKFNREILEKEILNILHNGLFKTKEEL
ncbi:MAG: TetR/AcrR family transcriptional regulator [candidate division WOR-3 bacterium]